MSTAIPSAATSNGGSVQSAAGGLPILTPQYLQAHVVGSSGKDVIWQPLRDAQAYPTTGGTVFTFFNQGIGSGSTSEPGAGAAVAKTIYDTNVKNQNMLPMGQEFYAIGSETFFLPGVQPTTGTPYAFFPTQFNATTLVGLFQRDIWAVYNAGHKVFTVGTDRKYIDDGPLFQFPPAKWFHMAGALAEIAATSNATSFVTEQCYGVAAGEPYTIVPVYLQSTQQFTLEIDFAAAIPTPSGLPGRLIERLRGYLIRQIT